MQPNQPTTIGFVFNRSTLFTAVALQLLLLTGTFDQYLVAQTTTDPSDQKSILAREDIEHDSASEDSTSEPTGFRATVKVVSGTDQSDQLDASKVEGPTEDTDPEGATFTMWRKSDNPQSNDFHPPRHLQELMQQGNASPPAINGAPQLESRDEPSNSINMSSNSIGDAPPLAPKMFPPKLSSRSLPEVRDSVDSNSAPPQEEGIYNAKLADEPQLNGLQPMRGQPTRQAITASQQTNRTLPGEAQPERPLVAMPKSDPLVRPAAFNQGGTFGRDANVRPMAGSPSGQFAGAPPTQLPMQPTSNTVQPSPATSKQQRRQLLKQALVPAKNLIDRFDVQRQRTVPGTPVSLYAMLNQPIAAQQRRQLIRQYWETYNDWAALVVAREHQNWMQSLPANVSAAERLLIDAERRLAQDRLLAAEIQMGKSQSQLLDFFVNVGSDNFLPLPSDNPTVWPYNTRYEQLRKTRMLPSSLRGIDQMLEGTSRLIAQRALTVDSARKARSELLTAYSTRQTSLASAIQAAEVCRTAELDLVGSVVNYNEAIGHYMVTVSPTAPAEQLVTSLIGTAWKQRPTSTAAPQTQLASRANDPAKSGFSIMESKSSEMANSSLANPATKPPRIEDVLPIRGGGGMVIPNQGLAGQNGGLRAPQSGTGNMGIEMRPPGERVAQNNGIAAPSGFPQSRQRQLPGTQPQPSNIGNPRSTFPPANIGGANGSSSLSSPPANSFQR